MIMNYSVRNFFEKQTFETIEFSQSKRIRTTERLENNSLENVLDTITFDDDNVSQSAQELERSVNHMFLTKKRLLNAEPIANSELPLINKIKNTIILQEEATKRYIFKSTQQIYCVVTKAEIKNQDLYIVSFMNETYTRGLITSMNKSILSILIISLVFSSIFAQFIARRITNPLKLVEHQLNHIAHKEWQDDLKLNRQDEIGRLATSANIMQRALQEKERDEKNFIQTVSHDLKTPIMVIRSYAQAVLDGIIATDDIQNSIQLINNEALKMDDKIRSLIYLYTLQNQPNVFDDFKSVDSGPYLESLMTRFQYTTDNIIFSSQLENFQMHINEKTFSVALENILENALRFAENSIELTCKELDNAYEIKIFNDGSSLTNPERIFQRYETESKANTGLGMTITKEIIEHHKGKINAYNEKNGVSFIIHLAKLL